VCGVVRAGARAAVPIVAARRAVPRRIAPLRFVVSVSLVFLFFALAGTRGGRHVAFCRRQCAYSEIVVLGGGGGGRSGGAGFNNKKRKLN
jgi:hypothetical protein